MISNKKKMKPQQMLEENNENKDRNDQEQCVHYTI